MIQGLRENFNKSFSHDNYQEMYDYFHNFPPYQMGFKLSETPIFLSKNFGKKLYDVSESVVDQILKGKIISDDAIPPEFNVPNDSEHFHFLAIDFGICQDEHGNVVPQLIELQAFPSLFFYQLHLAQKFRTHYNIPSGYSVLPHKELNEDAYISNLKELILGEYDPTNVVLLDLYPREQKTGIDFALTKEHLGIKPVCITEIFREHEDLYYIREGVETPIYRIYNRLISDELIANPSLNLNFETTDKVNVDWITHPNWYFRISKYLLPKLHHQYVPKTYFLKDFPSDQKLRDYVLKPLFSFAGKGVNINPTNEDVEQIQNPANYILQEKKSYAPIFKDVNGDMAKAEIRLLYTWKPGEERPQMQMNLVRMTKSDKVNVDHLGANSLWTGSSVAFFEH